MAYLENRLAMYIFREILYFWVINGYGHYVTQTGTLGTSQKFGHRSCLLGHLRAQNHFSQKIKPKLQLFLTDYISILNIEIKISTWEFHVVGVSTLKNKTPFHCR